MSTLADGVPKSAQLQDNIEAAATEDEFGAKDYRKMLSLKTDHNSRPIYVVCYYSEISFHIYN